MAIGTTIAVAGVEVTSATIRGSVDTLIVDNPTQNTAPLKKIAYNPRHEITVEGIDDGYAAADTITAKGLTFRVTNATTNRSVGDVKKITLTGTCYPDIT